MGKKQKRIDEDKDHSKNVATCVHFYRFARFPFECYCGGPHKATGSLLPVAALRYVGMTTGVLGSVD